MISDVLGKRLLKALLKEKDLTKLIEASVSHEDLFGDAKEGLKHIADYLASTGTWPEQKPFSETTGIFFDDDDFPLIYTVDTVRKRSLKKKLGNYVESVIKSLDDSDPDTALDIIKNASLDLAGSRRGAKVVSYKETSPDRYAKYVSLKGHAGILGIPTPWKVMDKATQGWIDGSLNVLLAKQNTGKAQPVTQPVCTPIGFRPIGELKVGDKVTAANGRPTTVTGVFPQGKKRVFEVKFDDGTSTICCKEHLWKARKVGTKKWSIVPLETLNKKTFFKSQWEIPLCEPVRFSQGKSYSYEEIREVLETNKNSSLPERYMQSSLHTRLSILNEWTGFSYFSEVTKECSYTEMQSLLGIARSVGIYARAIAVSSKEGKMQFTVDLKSSIKTKRIFSITELPDEQECVCISVEDPDHLYLTDDYIVTHNTWGCCVIAEKCLRENKKVLFVTMEMPSFNIERRIDAVHYKIPFKTVRDANFDASAMDKMSLGIKDDSKLLGDIFIADKQLVKYVSDVYGIVQEKKPDIVIIDGGYRFKSKQSTSSWESSATIVGDLQTLAEVSGIPWVVSSQLNEGSEKANAEKRRNAWDVRYAKEWIINPDIVLGMYCDEDLRDVGKMEIVKLKERDSVGEDTGSSFLINWDLENMDFSEDTLGEEEDDSSVTY